MVMVDLDADYVKADLHRKGDIVLNSVHLYVCLSVNMLISLPATLRANCQTNLHEIFREGVE